MRSALPLAFIVGLTACCPTPLGLPAASARSMASASSEPAAEPAASPDDRKVVDVLEGNVSYYHDSLAGNHTANGEVYDPAKLSAASRTLPFGTHVRVTRIDNGKQVIVRINDRGPFGRRKRILDLSRAAAEQLDMIVTGVTRVRAEVFEGQGP